MRAFRRICRVCRVYRDLKTWTSGGVDWAGIFALEEEDEGGEQLFVFACTAQKESKLSFSEDSGVLAGFTACG